MKAILFILSPIISLFIIIASFIGVIFTGLLSIIFAPICWIYSEFFED
jgi:hypothetical protein